MMSIRSNLYLLIVAAGWFSACSQVDIPADENDMPVFTLKGQLNGADWQRSAGEGGLYLYTGYEPDAAGVWWFTGNLAPEGCPECPGRLSIAIQDSELRNGSPVPIETALPPGSYAYQSPPDTQVLALNRVQFTANYTGLSPALSYSWDFGDSTFSSEAMPVHDYPDATPTTVRLQVTGRNGCAANYAGEVFPGGGVPGNCRVFLVSSLDSTGQLILQANPVGGVPPYSYLWSNSQNLGELIGVSAPGNYCITLTDQSGCAVTTCTTVAAGPQNDICRAGFDYQTSKIDTFQVVQGNGLRQVSITYTDFSGKIFRSDGIRQPVNSLFAIDRNEPYELNEKGDKTRRLSIRFTVRLSANDGSEMDLTGFSGTWGVGYP